MKKVIAILAVAAVFTACSSKEEKKCEGESCKEDSTEATTEEVVVEDTVATEEVVVEDATAPVTEDTAK